MRRHGGRWGLSGSGDGLTARNRSSVGARRRCSDGLCGDAAQEAASAAGHRLRFLKGRVCGGGVPIPLLEVEIRA